MVVNNWRINCNIVDDDNDDDNNININNNNWLFANTWGAVTSLFLQLRYDAML